MYLNILLFCTLLTPSPADKLNLANTKVCREFKKAEKSKHCNMESLIIFFRIFAWRFSFDCTSAWGRSCYQRYLLTIRTLGGSSPRRSGSWRTHLATRLSCTPWHVALLSKTLKSYLTYVKKKSEEKFDCFLTTVKLGYSEQLRTGYFCSL